MYRIDPGGKFSIVHFFNGSEGSNPRGDLTQADDGFIYGTTSGGNIRKGTIYRLDPVAGAVTTVVSSGAASDLFDPGMTRASDGFLYGTTEAGGAANVGSVYRFDPAAGTVTTIYSFPATSSEWKPHAKLMQASDGYLYGATLHGGTNDGGTVYRTDPATGATTTVHSFTPGPSGQHPWAGLTQAGDGFLYGTTSSDAGAIYRLDPATGEVTRVHTFSATAPSGRQPYAAMTLARDGFLYGTTEQGGAANAGTVYRLDPATGAVATVHSFPGTALGGGHPFAGLTEAADGFLYGAAYSRNPGAGGPSTGSIPRLARSRQSTHSWPQCRMASLQSPDQSRPATAFCTARLNAAGWPLKGPSIGSTGRRVPQRRSTPSLGDRPVGIRLPG